MRSRIFQDTLNIFVLIKKKEKEYDSYKKKLDLINIFFIRKLNVPILLNVFLIFLV